MKRLLAGLLLIGVTGCGDISPPQSGSRTPTSPPPVTNVAEAAAGDPAVAALEKLGTKTDRNEHGKVIAVRLMENTKITDTGADSSQGVDQATESFPHRHADHRRACGRTEEGATEL